MRFTDIIAEMATAPPESFAGQMFYHGTSSAKSAKGILKNGLQSMNEPGRGSLLKPVDGMVYLTPDLGYALIYAAGGNYIGSSSYRIPYRGENKKEFDSICKARDGSFERYGFIFVVSGDKLSAVQPDEDQIGELYYFMLNNREPNPAYTEQNFVRAWATIKADANLWNRFRWHMNAWTTDVQKRRIKDGEMAYFASGGKRAVKTMSDELKRKLCEIGLHVAHNGALMPDECWKFDKTKIGWMDKNGSNFFEFATRVWPRS